MKFKFKPLHDFFSKEMQSQYIAGMVYVCDNPKLAGMIERWLNAKRFKVLADKQVMDITFKAGVVSYCLDDDLMDIVSAWVNAGQARWLDDALVTLDVEEDAGRLSGGAGVQAGVGN